MCFALLSWNFTKKYVSQGFKKNCVKNCSFSACMNDGREGGGFAAAGGAGDEDHAASEVGDFLDGFDGEVEAAEVGDIVLYVAHDDGDGAALFEYVDAESADIGFGVGEVHVAGVEEIIMVVPTPNDERNDLVLAAAAIARVDKVFSIGGAQAIAALAYGTKLVPRVDKIVGPGNIYVATAKREVFGVVGIDMIAGPSEIVIVSEGSSDPDWIAMDMFAQAEHDERASAILITPDENFISQVENSIERLLPEMERAKIIRASLTSNAAIIKVSDLKEAIRIVNIIAPEHLELSVSAPEALLDDVRHAGAIFIGHYAAESIGDYCAGPNHVLPTARTARFSSPLGVYDFQKKSSIIMCTHSSVNEIAKTASILAKGEGFTAHARSAEYRLNKLILSTKLS